MATSSGAVQGASAKNMAGQMSQGLSEIYSDIWDTKSKFYKTIFLSIGIFLVPFMFLAVWYTPRYLKQQRAADIKQASPVPETAVKVPRDESGNKIGRLVTVNGVSKVVFDSGQSLREMPENQKLQVSVMFTQDGTAIVFANIEYDGRGGDTVWHSKGKWYAILSDPVVKEHDFRFLGYKTPEDCPCQPVIVVSK